jgi:subtilase family serine protease
MALYLKPTADQDAAMTQLIADQQNPASPSYHQWLTPEQFGARFGVNDEDLAVLTSWLQARGFTVDSVAASRNRIVFSGTSSAVESAFAVTMQRYQQDGRSFYENNSVVQVPAELSKVIGGVTGLSSYRLAAPHLRRAAVEQTTANQPGLTPAFTTSNGGHYLVPWDFRQIFGINPLISSGFNGSGITIGVIGQSAVDTAQLTYFQQKTGATVQSPTFTLVPNTGVSNKLSGDEGESELDIEYAAGTAPGATINFIYTGCTSTTSTTAIDTSKTDCNNNGVFDALAYAITTKLANNASAVIPILTLSYGGCESASAAFATAGKSPFEGYLKQSNTQGQTVLISSGDEGAATCDQGTSKTTVASKGLSVSYPASSPYVTGVGGSTLNGGSSNYWSSTNNAFAGSATGYIPETSWNDSAAYKSIAASGGGVSKVFTKPSWQSATGVPADGYRDVPDVAFPANVTEFGYFTCTVDGACTNSTVGFGSSSGGGGIVGGTSVAAPNFAAMLAVIEQANGGGALGNVNPILYTLAQTSSYSTIFHDITTGNNIVSCAGGSADCSSQASNFNGTMGYSAGTGYDLVTGLGSLDASALRTALQAVTSKTPTLGLSVSSIPPILGTAVTFTLNVGSGSGSATPTGNVQFSVDGTNVGSAVALASGSAATTYTFTSTGIHTVAASYGGDSNYNAGLASINVTASLPIPTVTLTPANSTVAPNTAATFTAAVAFPGGATPSGSVQFQVDGVNSGSAVTLSSGVATYTYAGASTSSVHTITAIYSGSTTYASVSSTTTITVGTGSSVPYTMSVTPTSITVASGSTGTETLTVTPSSFSGTVNLTYTVATNSGATFAGCLTATSSTIALTGSTAVTLPLTVRASATGCPSAGVLPLKVVTAKSTEAPEWHHTGFALISAAGLLGCCFLRRRLRPGLLMLVALGALTVGMSGCGSSSSSTTSTSATNSGNYTVTLTGTSGTSSASTSFTLIVQ